MADPNRKINLDLPSDEEEEEDDNSSIDEVIPLNPAEISLVKDFEEEFKYRFTDEDTVFTEFCKQKPKPPPIVFPFDSFNNHRGGHRGRGGGGRFHHRGGGGGQNYDNHRSNYGQQRYNNHQPQWNRSRDDHEQPSYKRPRDDARPGAGGT